MACSAPPPTTHSRNSNRGQLGERNWGSDGVCPSRAMNHCHKLVRPGHIFAPPPLLGRLSRNIVRRHRLLVKLNTEVQARRCKLVTSVSETV